MCAFNIHSLTYSSEVPSLILSVGKRKNEEWMRMKAKQARSQVLQISGEKGRGIAVKTEFRPAGIGRNSQKNN